MHDLPTLLVLGVVLVLGHYAGVLARRVRLPSLIGYMVFGVVVGPSLLGFLTASRLAAVGFLTELALGFVAFMIGSELSLKSLRKLGGGIAAVILAESLLAFVVVLGAVYLVSDNLPLALLFGGLAPASAPAGTVAVIQEYRAEGKLTKALYAVVGFDDGLAILIFGFAGALAQRLLVAAATGADGGFWPALWAPCVEIVLSLVVGTVVGFVFCHLARRVHDPPTVLTLVLGAVVIMAGVAQAWHLSLILTNMAAGFLMVNTRRKALVDRVVGPIRYLMPSLYILFFCIAGAHLRLQGLAALGLLGAVYVLARTFGLIGGAWLGGTLGRVDGVIRRYVGLGILSQAGVAIGLCLIIRQDLLALKAEHAAAFDALAARLPDWDPATLGATVIATITATCILFEIIGPILTRVALVRAGEVPDKQKAQ